MKYFFLKRIVAILMFFFCFFSCSSDLNFQQVDDFNTQPVYTTNFVYFEVKASDFIINDREQSLFSYVSHVDFKNIIAQKDLVKADLNFRIKNTINRAYTYNITFLSINNAPIYTINMNVPAYKDSEIVVEKNEMFDKTNVTVIKATKKIVFSIIMYPGTTLTKNSLGRIELSSDITGYFEL